LLTLQSNIILINLAISHIKLFEYILLIRAPPAVWNAWDLGDSRVTYILRGLWQPEGNRGHAGQHVCPFLPPIHLFLYFLNFFIHFSFFLNKKIIQIFEKKLSYKVSPYKIFYYIIQVRVPLVGKMMKCKCQKSETFDDVACLSSNFWNSGWECSYQRVGIFDPKTKKGKEEKYATRKRRW